MRRWFLSYHSTDHALAERLKVAIEHKDAAARVFFAPTSLLAGASWSRALANEIAQADAFILLLGEKVGDWQVLEYNEALDRWVHSPDFPLLVMLLEGHKAPGLQFLRQLHWIVTADPASEKDVARLIDAASGRGARSGALWRYTSPYRGLSAMEEKDSDYFFGRGRETVEILDALADAPNRLPVLFGNSGVGKSSLARAGVIAALKRRAWPEGQGDGRAWPQAFAESRHWCFLSLKPGTDPLRALVASFLDTWQFDATDPERAKRQNGWIDLLRDPKASLSDLLDATERRYQELDRDRPPAFFLYIDQGEELYVRAEERERFSQLIAQGVADPRVFGLVSMRADFLGDLLKDEPLYRVHRQINVPPLREAGLRDVVSRPAQLLSARFETDGLVDIITRRTAEDAVKEVGALPLLSYTLDDMWTQMAKRDDGVLRLPAQSFELGGVLVDRANSFLATHPGTEDSIRRVLTLKLATVRQGEEPTRRRAWRSEFSNEEWRLVSELADHPNRLLVTATYETGETYAEVAHEAIFRRWGKLGEWIAAEREFLAWRTGLEAGRRAWAGAPVGAKNHALLMGFALQQAQDWLGKHPEGIGQADQDFIAQSGKAAQSRRRRLQALVGGLIAVIVAGLGARWKEQWLKEQAYWLTAVRGHVLTTEYEHSLKPLETFRECTDCPDLVVLRAGEFMMGSPPREAGRRSDEGPQHKVLIAKPFAVSKFEVTSDQWDACVKGGGCPQAGYSAFGRGTRPVTNISWDAAEQYVAWLSRLTGKSYRLLSEAEWEYAARGGTATRFFFGDDEAPIGQYAWYHVNSAHQTNPVGKKEPNSFGLFDMHGNVWEWCADTWHPNYEGAPQDGSVWRGGDTSLRVLRGGSWWDAPDILRSANRNKEPPSLASFNIGLRIARTLSSGP
jgi:formylglycine-generating enzyme required for sulfatase activity